MQDSSDFRFPQPRLRARILFLKGPYVRRKAKRLQPTDNVPADIHLPPVSAEACRRRIRVMIPVPVLSPRSDLQGAEPPDVLARVHAIRQSGLEVKEAVDERLHVEAVHQANGAKPEESGPAKQEVSERE